MLFIISIIKCSIVAVDLGSHNKIITYVISKGVGFYGVVMKVKDKSGNFYAMKVCR